MDVKVIEVGEFFVAVHAAPTPQASAVAEEIFAVFPDVVDAAPTWRLAVGGDGTVLRCLQAGIDDGVPCYGISAGHVGFLANSRPEVWAELPGRLEVAQQVPLRPLHVRAVTESGDDVVLRCLNDVSLLRHSSQAANLSITIDGVTRLEPLAGDGVVIATPLGSTAYTRAAHGPVLPLEAPLIAVTPLAAYRPRFSGAVVMDSAEIVVDVLDADTRPVLGSADQFDLGRVRSLRVHRDRGQRAVLACDPHDHLAERIMSAAFAG